MVYAHINTVPHGSTGGIMMKEHRELLAAGEDSYAFWGRGREAENANEMKFCTDLEVKLDALQTRLDGRAGFHSRKATARLLARLDEINPDVVHLHNLHGYYLNIEMLFEWLASHSCKVEWTLHDCWAFTGHCAYFTYAGCERWMKGCKGNACPQLDAYPKTYSKKSCETNYLNKSKLFSSVPPTRMRLIAPSQWMADLVAASFLSHFDIEVRYNTIDQSIFKPTPSDFRERFSIGGRFMILGVATPWNERKGLDDFLRLAFDVDMAECIIVLVGLSARQIEGLPAGVIGFERTESVEKLAEMYSAADVYFLPTKEDNFPTTLLEAQACGTLAITYDIGGCREALLPGSIAVSSYEEARAAIKDLMAKRRVKNAKK